MTDVFRSRCTLHKSKLVEFRDFCERHGWYYELPKGDYEVLRMRHPDCKDPLIVHDRVRGSHFTTWGESARMVNQYLDSRRQL